MQNLNDNFLNQNHNLKSLAGSIAHEVRNPLSAIKGCCEVIKGNLDEAMEYLDLISISSSRGLMIAEMILSNIREQEIDKSQFTNLLMSNIIKSALKEYAFGSREERNLVNINLENDFSFKGEETLMIFVLFNLLKNSLYYKAKIDIWLEKGGLIENGINYNLLHFKDCGVGIDENKLAQIFDSFFTSDKKQGTGLGLPFCKKVMNAFGGDISVKSEAGKYTQFILRFS